MQTLTSDQFKQRYGVMGQSQFTTSQKKEEEQQSFLAQVKQAFQGGIEKAASGYEESKPGGTIGGLIEGQGKMLGGTTEAIASPIAPIFAPISKAINYVSDKISNSPTVQKFATSPAGEKTAKVAESVGNYDEALGLIAGGPKAPGAITSKVGEAVSNIPKPPLGPAGSYLKSAAKDIVPTIQNVIDHNLAAGLDLTPGDLTIISKSTGNNVGQWMADNNLIGTNKATTQGLINNFFAQNYKGVRTEIGKVKQAYKPSQVPRYTDALKAIQAKIQGVVGLEKEAATVDNLLNKKSLSLEDVQKTKELVDDYSSLYTKQGDVLQGIEKQGLATVRDGLKTFIEQQVQRHTGADIGSMNNNVATAKNLLNAIEKRSSAGITKSMFGWRDAAIGMGLTYFGSPMAGIAAVTAWKLITSPTVRLRFARFLDGLNDAQRARISHGFSTGDLPKDALQIVNETQKSPTQ